MDRYYFEHLTSLQEIATSAPSGPPRNDTVIWQLAASIQQSDKFQFEYQIFFIIPCGKGDVKAGLWLQFGER